MKRSRADDLTDIHEGVIVYILKQIEKPIYPKWLQRFIYLGQALGANTWYRFRMRITGPYSEDLAYDLAVLDLLAIIDDEGLVSIRDPEWKMSALAEVHIEVHQEAFDRLFELFGSFSMDELNTFSIMLFAEKMLDRPSEKEEVLRAVAYLLRAKKVTEVSEAYDYLKDNRCLMSCIEEG